MNKAFAIAILMSFTAATVMVARSDENTANNSDKDLADDLALLQGSWELLHGNVGKAPPSIRSVKTIEGNKETLRRYSTKTDKLLEDHSVEFKLTKSGNVRVFTFYAIGDSPMNGFSYVYKVDKQNFYDVPGLLHEDGYQNYQEKPRVWHWKRISGDEPVVPPNTPETKQEN